VKTLLLDTSTWDLVLDVDGNIAAAADPYSIAQDVASAIKLFFGELWYDTTKGVPYFGTILGEAPSIPYMKARFAAAALTVPLVIEAVCYLSSLSDRNVQGQVQVTDANNQTSVVTFTPNGAQITVGT
jgi:hypothetical protein